MTFPKVSCISIFLFSNLIFSFALISSSCSVLTGSDTELKSDAYKLNFKSSSWSSVDADNSDYAFINRRTNSILVLNTLCKKYDTAPLNTLAKNALSDLTNAKFLTQEKITYSEREALRTKATGKMDGVEVFLLIQTVRKNRCIYDFFLISPNEESLTKDLNDFEIFLNSVAIN